MLVSRIDKAVKSGALHGRNGASQEGGRRPPSRAPVTDPSRGHRLRRGRLRRDGLRLGALTPRVPRADRVRRRARRNGCRPARRHDPGRGRRRRPPPCADATAAQHRDRPLRDPDDGEPVVRPLLRLGPRRRRVAAAERHRAPDGRMVPTRHFSTLGTGGVQYKGCGHPDPGHGWESAARSSMAASWPRGPTPTSSRSPTTTGASWASSTRRRASTRCTTASSARSSPRPGRTGTTSGPRSRAAARTTLRRSRRAATSGKRSSTAPSVAASAPATTTRTFPSRWGPRGAAWTNPIARYYEDCAAGTLPNIAIVDPPFKDGGGGDGLSADEHLLGDTWLGQAFMADVVNAFVTSRNFRRGAIFVVYDEWGGFFDHVRPPRAVDGRPAPTSTRTSPRWASASRPWRSRPTRRIEAPRYRADHGTYGFESFLKLISYRFGLGYLNKRHRYARNIGRSFNWSRPDFMPPKLPDPPQIATRLRRRRHRRGGLPAGPRQRPRCPGGPGRPGRSAGLRLEGGPDLYPSRLGEARSAQGAAQERRRRQRERERRCRPARARA